jgi:hypothetical protein
MIFDPYNHPWKIQEFIGWHTPKLFNRLKWKSKVKTAEGQRIEAHSLARNTSG